MGSMLNASPELIGLSSITEAGISAAQGASAGGGAAALIGVTQMGGDVTSELFAEALRATGAAYLAAIGEHVGQRGAFAGGQALAAATFSATEAIRGATATLGELL